MCAGVIIALESELAFRKEILTSSSLVYSMRLASHYLDTTPIRTLTTFTDSCYSNASMFMVITAQGPQV